MQKKFKKDISGKQFSNLKVVVFNPNTGKWICQCVCGNVIEVEAKNLTSNRVKSCGCQKYIRIKNKEGSYPRLLQTYHNLQHCNEASDWEDWEDFKNWSLGHSKENLIFGIRYNSQFLPIESAKDWKIFYNSEDKEFLIRFRYNNTTVKQEHIKTIPELCQLHIKIYRRYFHKASFFE